LALSNKDRYGSHDSESKPVKKFNSLLNDSSGSSSFEYSMRTNMRKNVDERTLELNKKKRKF
jgi:hypothetical protein